MAGHVTRVVDQIVRTLREVTQCLREARSLDLKRGLHLSLAGLLLLANGGLMAPIVVAPSATSLARAPHGVDGGTATYLQPPRLPSSTEAVVVVSTLPEGHLGDVVPAYNDLGIPRSALRAYRAAADHSNAVDPRCGLSVALLAAIGRVESGHARGGNVDESGTTLQPILGPRLDGSSGVAAIADTDQGRYDGDTSWDHAVGPMQFIPSTWAGWAADGSGDGVASPHNIYDATVAAGNYLCAGDRDLRQTGDLHAAILSYNHSTQYLRIVLAWMTVYFGEAVAIPDIQLGGATQVSNKTPGDGDRAKRNTVQATPAQPQYREETDSGTSSPVRAAAAPTRQPTPPSRPAERKVPVPDKPDDPAKAVKDTAKKLTTAELVAQTLDVNP